MSYDKVAGNVGYIDSSHIYEDRETKKQYMSVTTLIHKFVPEFKADYWSTYKAVKDVLEHAGMWFMYKQRAGGWEKVVPYFRANQDDLTQDILDLIANRQQWYLVKWEDEKNDACDKGSKIHEELENAAYHAQYIRENDVNYEVSQEDILNIQDFDRDRSYPELLIYNDLYMVAGQVDKVFKQGRYVDIHDYKTCKEITNKGFRGETLLAPLAHLQNANYWIYTLQLSMYGWMLEQCGYKLRGLYMHWIHGENKEDKQRNAGVKTFQLQYLKQEVVALMEAKARL